MTWPGEQVVAPEQAATTEPVEERGAGEQLGRALVAGGSRVVRGLVESELAVEEALPVVSMASPTRWARELGDFVPALAGEPKASERMHAAWKGWEERLYEPSEPDMYKAWDALMGGDPVPFAQFVGEGVINSVPGMLAAMYSAPVVMASYIGDIAKTRATNQGRDKVAPEDLAFAVPAAAAVGALEKVGARAFAWGGFAKGMVGEALTEMPQELVQAAAEEAGTAKGIDWGETLKQRVIPAGVIGGFAGGGAGLGGSLARRATRPPTDPTTEAPPTVIVEPEATPYEEARRELEALRAALPDIPTPTEAVVEEVTEEVAPEAAPIVEVAPGAEVLGSREQKTATFGAQGGRLVLWENSPGAGGAHSIVEFLVDEDRRGQGIGGALVDKVVEEYAGEEISGQVSSAASLRLLHGRGFRPPGQPNATMERALEEFNEFGSLNMRLNERVAVEEAPTPTEAVVEGVVEETPTAPSLVQPQGARYTDIEGSVRRLPTDVAGLRAEEATALKDLDDARRSVVAVARTHGLGERPPTTPRHPADPRPTPSAVPSPGDPAADILRFSEIDKYLEESEFMGPAWRRRQPDAEAWDAFTRDPEHGDARDRVDEADKRLRIIRRELAPKSEPQGLDAQLNRVRSLVAQGTIRAVPPLTEEVVEGVVEETAVPKDTVPGEFDQIAPPPLPMEAGPDVPGVIISRAATVTEELEQASALVKAIMVEERKAQKAVATRPGTKPVERKKGRKLNEAEQKLHELESVEAALDPVRPVVDVLDAAVESEAAGTRVLAGTQDVMRAANEDVVAFLESMGRTPEQISNIMRREAAGYAETLQRMRAEGLETTVDGAGNIHMSEKMSELVDILLERPYQVSGIEQTALLSGLVQSQKAWRDTMQRIGELDAKEAANPVERNAIDGEIRRLDAKRREISEIGDKIGAANAVAGTRTSEAFKARNWGVDSEMTLFQARAKARGLKGSKLDSTQAEFIDKEFAEADKLIAEATKAKAEADKKLKDANRKLLAATKDLKRAQGIKEATARVAKKTKPKEARKKARKKAAEDLAAEAEGKPIRVTPIKPSAREKAARKAFKEAQKKAKAALGEVADAQGKRVKADGITRDARTRKRKAPEEALKWWVARQWAHARDMARAMTASGDVSAFGRQGAMMVLESPVVAVKTLRHAVGVAPWKGDAARAYAEKEQRKILSEPMQQVRDWAGLEMTEVEGLTNVKGGPMQAREETFVTDVFKSGWLRPLNEWLIRPSQNSFGLMLNEMRKANFDEGMKILAERRGADPDATPEQIMKLVPKEDARALAAVINASSGRGSWLLTSPAVGRGAGVVNVADTLVKNMLFAPRHSVSRAETMSHFFSMLAGTGRFKDVSRGDEGALNVFRKRAAKVFTLWASIGLMSVLAAGEFEDEELSEEEKSRRKKQAADNFLNPGHADFMKGRLGKHHFDVFGGVPSTVRLLVPFAIAPIEGKYELEPRLASKFGRLVRNKLNPLISAASKAAYNEDYLGRELVSDEEGWLAHALHRVILPGIGAFTPITVQNVAEQVTRDANDEDIDAMDAAASQFLEAIGVGDPVYTEGWKSPEMRARGRRPKKRPKYTSPRY
jgi:GNAT superfamily N-acetyltransferase